jgi:uncharacterized protein
VSSGVTGYTPQIEVTVDGQPVSAVFYSLLMTARIKDNEGQEADSCDLTFDDRDNAIALPRKGAEVSVKLGYRETGLFDKGRFKVETVSIRGDVGIGEALVISAKAADLRKDAKAEKRKSYENTTVKEMMEDQAKAMGLQAVVDPEIGAIEFDFRIFWDQSHLDFVTHLADEIGAVVKPAGGKLVVQKRGSGKSPRGGQLELIIIRPEDCSSWEIEPDGRMQYGRVESHWVDPKTGKRRVHKEDTGLQGPPFVVREAFPDEKRAKKGAEAEKGRLNRQTGNGRFTLYGRPSAQAGAPVQLVGFRRGALGEWRAAAVEHIYQAGPNGGYTTLIEIKAKEDGKKGQDDD